MPLTKKNKINKEIKRFKKPVNRGKKAQQRRRKGTVPQKGSTRKKTPRRLVVYPNYDKMDHEKWEEGRDMSDFPRPYRLLSIGGVNSGKTNITLNLCAVGNFDRIIVCHLDGESAEYDLLDIKDEDRYENCLPEIEDFNRPEDSDSESDDDEEEKPFFTLLIIEDMSFKKSNSEDLSRVFRYVSTHKNVSVIMNYQNMTDIPPIARRLANIFNVYPMVDRIQTEIVGRRVGCDKNQLAEMLTQICTEPYSFITFDFTNNTPYPIRKNLSYPIKKVVVKEYEDPEGNGIHQNPAKEQPYE